ncbi:hypothetical protein pb186bvf_020183 [Paramecium bursaria]
MIKMLWALLGKSKQKSLFAKQKHNEAVEILEMLQIIENDQAKDLIIKVSYYFKYKELKRCRQAKSQINPANLSQKERPKILHNKNLQLINRELVQLKGIADKKLNHFIMNKIFQHRGPFQWMGQFMKFLNWKICPNSIII